MFVFFRNAVVRWPRFFAGAYKAVFKGPISRGTEGRWEEEMAWEGERKGEGKEKEGLWGKGREGPMKSVNSRIRGSDSGSNYLDPGTSPSLQ